MARKKNAKNAKLKKTSAKRQGKTTTLGNPLERTFRDIPNKLIAQSRKELTGLTKQEKKLKTELKKAQAQGKNLQKQHKTLTAKFKTSPTAASKKQLNTLKANTDKNTKSITGLTTQLNDLKTSIKSLNSYTAKYTAIHKHLTAFDKEWENNARKSAATPTKKTRKTTAKKTDTTSTQNPTAPQTTFEEDTFNTTQQTPPSREIEPVE